MRHISSQNVDIGLFTNGNAVISENSSKRCVASEEMLKSEKSDMAAGNCSTLSSFLSLSLNAGDVGAQKPSIVPFVAISQRSGIPPSRILYVGDNYEHDVVAAKRANFHAAHLQRPGSGKDNTSIDNTTKENIEKGSNVLNPDIVLHSLDPSEFSTKIKQYILNTI